jgi:hypothetical protein
MRSAFPVDNISSTFNTVSGGNIDTAAHYNDDNVTIDINDVVIVDDDDDDDDELPPLIRVYENEDGSTYYLPDIWLPEAALPIMDDDWKKRNYPLGREREEYRRRIREIHDSPNTVMPVIMDGASINYDDIPRGISDRVGTATTSRAVPSGHTQDIIDLMFYKR